MKAIKSPPISNEQHLYAQVAGGCTPDKYSGGCAPIVALDGCICVCKDALPGLTETPAFQQVCILALRPRIQSHVLTSAESRVVVRAC